MSNAKALFRATRRKRANQGPALLDREDARQPKLNLESETET